MIFSSFFYEYFFIKYDLFPNFNEVLNSYDGVLTVETHRDQGNNPQFLFYTSTELYDGKHL